MPAKDNMLEIEKLKKAQREDAVIFCLCGAQMEVFQEQRYDGWKCPNCGRKRTVISDHRKDPTRWPEGA